MLGGVLFCSQETHKLLAQLFCIPLCARYEEDIWKKNKKLKWLKYTSSSEDLKIRQNPIRNPKGIQMLFLVFSVKTFHQNAYAVSK